MGKEHSAKTIASLPLFCLDGTKKKRSSFFLANRLREFKYIRNWKMRDIVYSMCKISLNIAIPSDHGTSSRNTVDGRNPANHLGCKTPCK